jgi:hypothetical protein
MLQVMPIATRRQRLNAEMTAGKTSDTGDNSGLLLEVHNEEGGDKGAESVAIPPECKQNTAGDFMIISRLCKAGIGA